MLTACIRYMVLVAVILGNHFTATNVHAQLHDSGKKAWIVEKCSLSDFSGKSDSIVADFDSENEASDQAKQLNETLKGNEQFAWIYSYRRRPEKALTPTEQSGNLLSRLKEAKEQVDRAKRIADGNESIVSAAERKLGDTIKEYRDMAAESYRRAVDAKKTLANGVAELADTNLREVNGLVDKYNGELKDFKAVMAGSAGLGLAPLERAVPPEATEDEVVGTWVTENGSTRYNFHSDGSVVVEGSRTTGRWTRSGNSVTINFGTPLYYTLSGSNLISNGAVPLRKVR